MRNYKFPILLIALAVVSLPLSVHAIASTSYIIDQGNGGITSSHSPLSGGDYDLDSTSYKLDASIETFVGNTSSATFKLEAGDTFEYYCGDGFRDAAETCDGTLLNGSNCAAQGFDGGTLACASDCTFDTTSCSNSGGGGGGGGGGGVPNAPAFDALIAGLKFTYESSMLLYGTKGISVDDVLVDGSAKGVSYPTTSTWNKTVSLSFGLNTFVFEALDGVAVSATSEYEIYRRLIGDLTQDDTVNDYDLSKLVGLWGDDDRSGDFNGDGEVDDYDFSMMVARWGTSV